MSGPGVLPPPGWYNDPETPGQHRFWDGAQWTEHRQLTGPSWNAQPWAPTTPAVVAPTLRPPRSRLVRTLLTVGAVFGIYAGAIVVAVPFSAAATKNSDPGSLVAVLVLLGAYAALAARVSYRWFDCFFLLIPIYGLIWMFRIAWRVAYLPYRDWQPRPAEAATWTRVDGGPGAKRAHFLVRR